VTYLLAACDRLHHCTVAHCNKYICYLSTQMDRAMLPHAVCWVDIDTDRQTDSCRLLAHVCTMRLKLHLLTTYYTNKIATNSQQIEPTEFEL